MALRKLSPTDASFLASETPTSPMHVAGLVVVDPSDAGDRFGFEAVRDTVVERLPELPQLRWRPVEFPFGLDLPFWVEDEAFDPEYHIRRIAVPAPGGEAELNELAARLLADPLDRSKPLWELWFVEGVSGGKVALFQKIHHAMIDGVTGTGLSELLYDTTPEPRAAPTVTRESLRDIRVPGTPELLVRGIANVALRTPTRAARELRPMAHWALAAMKLRSGGNHVFPHAPPCSIDGPLTSRRRLAFERVSLERVKAVKQAFGVKVNDVILALASGALRRYLRSIDDLPTEPLIANMPMSLRTDADRDEIGNKIALVYVPIATDVTDAACRLLTIAESTLRAKAVQRELEFDPMMEVANVAPPGLIGLVARSHAWQAMAEGTPRVTTTVSNVPGPPMRLYVCGAPIEAILPTGPLLMGIGLNIGVLTYAGDVTFGVTACPERVPDPQRVADGIEPALAELEDAVGLRTAVVA